MARSVRIRKTPPVPERNFAAQHSRFKTATVRVPWESNDNPGGNFRVSINVAQRVFDGWLHEDADFFDPSHIKFVARCTDMWNRIAPPNYRITESEGISHAKAMKRLAEYKRAVPRYAWDIFENVCRWNEPTGIPGSRYAAARPACVRAAKHIVRYVAEELS